MTDLPVYHQRGRTVEMETNTQMSVMNVKSTVIRDSIESSNVSELPKKASEVLDAARRVVDRDGADGLTLRAVAQEAGVPSSLAIYYFGSMAKLEALLLDSIWRDEVVQHLHNLENTPASLGARVDMLVSFHSTIAKNLDGFRTYCELITHVMRNEATRRNVARIYNGYRWELNFPLLVSSAHSRRRSIANAAVMLATGEGLPLGCLLGESEDALFAGFNLLSRLFRTELSDKQEGNTVFPNASQVARSVNENLSEFVPTELHLNSTSRKLLLAGTELLHQGGLREITFGNIAKVSGESKGLISYYFKSKHGFLDALVSMLLHEWTERVRNALIDRKSVTPNSLIKSLYGEKSVLVSLILLQPMLRHDSGRQNEVRSAYNQTVASLSTLFDDNAYFEHSAVTAATVFLAALNGLALQSLYDPKGFDLRSALQALLTLLPPLNVTRI